MQKTYESVESINGSILVVEGTEGVKCDELVEVISSGEKRTGKVLEVDGSRAVVILFGSTQGLSTVGLKVKFLGHPMKLGVSLDMLGRIFDGKGKPVDGGPEILPEKIKELAGKPINPQIRIVPSDFIETGISAIDVMNPLVRGQKFSLLSGAGFSPMEIAAQIARQAKTRDGSDFSIVLGAMGVTSEEALSFEKELERTGAIERTTLFINTASDPVTERILVPELALSFAEYLAFDKNKHVLVILTNLTNYIEAFREISAAEKAVSRGQTYSQLLHADFGSLYERAGCMKGSEGSITQMSIFSGSEDDMAHGVPDAEGRIIMDRELQQKLISPPINVLKSLSHFAEQMTTREDHLALRAQLFSCFTHGKEVRKLMTILGENSLSDLDKIYLEFTNKFEQEFIGQGRDVERSLSQSLTLGWKLLSPFPSSELKHLDTGLVEKYGLQ